MLLAADGPTRRLLYSAEGGGKTVTAAMWAIVQVLLLAAQGSFVAGGATAPTHERLQTLVKAICERVPSDSAKSRKRGAWCTYFADAREIRFATGHVIQCRSTKKQSAEVGSPIQGFTWGFHVGDEIQDSADADADIEARLRGAKVSRRLNTATAKDSPGWRTFRDAKLSSPDWGIERIRFDENPFVWPEHWDRMRRNMSEREWQRRGLALDVGPERQLYYAWERAENLRPLPRLGAKDVTRQVIGYDALIGHDPGRLFDVSILLKCYEVQRIRCWWALDEVTTEQTIIDEHIALLREHLRSKWALQTPEPDGPRVLVRYDPYSDSMNAENDRSQAIAWRQGGFKAMSAAYNAKGEGKGVINREARWSMMNRLCCDANKVRRFFVDCDEARAPACKRLVDALETASRDEAGRGEAEKKGARDQSHWPAACAMGLWPYERVRDGEGVAAGQGFG